MAYLNKYTCTECGTSCWALGDPLQCGRCFGTMVMTVQGTTDVPSALYYETKEESIQFDWDNFNKWWAGVNSG